MEKIKCYLCGKEFEDYGNNLKECAYCSVTYTYNNLLPEEQKELKAFLKSKL